MSGTSKVVLTNSESKVGTLYHISVKIFNCNEKKLSWGIFVLKSQPGYFEAILSILMEPREISACLILMNVHKYLYAIIPHEEIRQRLVFFFCHRFSSCHSDFPTDGGRVGSAL